MPTRLAKSQFEQLAAFRQALRRFQHFSREAAQAAGLTAQQHQALLAIKGFPGRDFVSVGELAEKLQLKHNSMVSLVARLARRHLVSRTPAADDRRRLEVRLTVAGEQVIRRLSAAHLKELRQLRPALQRLLESIPGD